VLETRVVLGGVPVTLVDTAGLRESADAIEAEGVRRALARAAEADLVIGVVAAGEDANTPPPLAGGGWGEGFPSLSRPPSPVPLPQGEGESYLPPSAPRLLVMNKVDLGGDIPPGTIGVSALTGAGLDALRARLGEAAWSLTESAGPPPLTQARHRAALQEAAARFADAGTADLPELRAEDLRLALRAIGRITGSVGVEDILDTLFTRFCIGK
jgi:tRNA modification GTPase